MSDIYDPPDPPDDEQYCAACDEPLAVCECGRKTEPEDFPNERIRDAGFE